MPELPEVETVRRGLERLLVGRKIVSVEVHVPKMVRTDADTFLLDLQGAGHPGDAPPGEILNF